MLQRFKVLFKASVINSTNCSCEIPARQRCSLLVSGFRPRVSSVLGFDRHRYSKHFKNALKSRPRSRSFLINSLLTAPDPAQAINQFADRIPFRVVWIPTITPRYSHRRQRLFTFELHSMHHFATRSHADTVYARERQSITHRVAIFRSDRKRSTIEGFVSPTNLRPHRDTTDRNGVIFQQCRRKSGLGSDFKTRLRNLRCEGQARIRMRDELIRDDRALPVRCTGIVSVM